jgi:hypothetical protein
MLFTVLILYRVVFSASHPRSEKPDCSYTVVAALELVELESHIGGPGPKRRRSHYVATVRLFSSNIWHPRESRESIEAKAEVHLCTVVVHTFLGFSISRAQIGREYTGWAITKTNRLPRTPLSALEHSGRSSISIGWMYCMSLLSLTRCRTRCRLYVPTNVQVCSLNSNNTY